MPDVPYCLVAVLTGQEQYFLQTESITSWMGVKFGLAMEVWQRLWLCLPKHPSWMRKLVWWIESMACREDVNLGQNQLKYLIPNIFFLSYVMHQRLLLSEGGQEVKSLFDTISMHILMNARIWPREISLVSFSCMLKGHGITADSSMIYFKM